MIRDERGKPLRVVDVKYKNVSAPSAEDVAQVVTYATAVRANEAVLVFPHPIRWSAMVGPIHVRAVGVRLDDDLSIAAEQLATLLHHPRMEVALRLSGFQDDVLSSSKNTNELISI
jgi:hypothetical protein